MCLKSNKEVRGPGVSRRESPGEEVGELKGLPPSLPWSMRQRKLREFTVRALSHQLVADWNPGLDPVPHLNMTRGCPGRWHFCDLATSAPACCSCGLERRMMEFPLRLWDKSWRPHWFSLSCPPSSQLDPQGLQSP